MKNFSNTRKKSEIRSTKPAIVITDKPDFCVAGYVNLADNPEIMAGCHMIAQLIGSLTIHLMNNTESGDERIVNELSRMFDITPAPGLTRQKFIEFIVMTMLINGRGNAIVKPHTRAGILKRLEPISYARVGYVPIGYSDYRVNIDGKTYRPSEILHFTYNPDDIYPWKGKGINVCVRDIANGLKQAQATKTGFLSCEYYTPSSSLLFSKQPTLFPSPTPS